MQASESSPANLLKPAFASDSQLLSSGNAKADSVTARMLPSAFSAPIQAARKYLERQRADAGQIDPHQARSLLGGASQHGETGLENDQKSRERDRRLERSLYQGHSLEAGLDFESCFREDDGGSEGGTEEARAYLIDGDGSEPLFSYATAGPSPDPGLVRGAIQRLARESELQRGSGTEARRSSAPTAGAETRESIAGNTFPQSNVPVFQTSGPVQVPDFGEVARRVWEVAGSGGVESGNDLARNNLATAIAAESDAREPVTGDQRSPALGGGAPSSGLPAAQQRIAAPGEGREKTEERAAPLAGADASVSGPAAAVVRAATSVAGKDAGETLAEATTAQANPNSAAQARPALAHDACNLLSALGLYSELLATPGVLAAHHRHYADELKLLAGRSQVLIDRLLRSSTAPAPQAAPASVSPATAGEQPALIGSVAAAEAVSTVDLAGGEEGEEGEEGEKGEQEVQWTSLADLLMRWGSLLSTLAHGTLEVVLGPHASTPVPVGAEALERILVNLVRNARAATVAGGAIRIGVAAEDSRNRVEGEIGPHGATEAPPARTMVLTVDDSGCGMTEDQVRRILESSLESNLGSSFGAGAASAAEDVPLYRAAAAVLSDGYGRWPGNGRYVRDGVHEPEGRSVAPEHDQRQGLGLQIVRELVQNSGGAFSIASRSGRGTRIEISWPVGFQDRATVPAAKAQPEPATATETGAPSAGVQTSEPGAATELRLPVETSRLEEIEAAAPEELSEMALRAMVLRLQRGAPPERSPFTRRLGDRRLAGQRDTTGRPADNRLASDRPASDRPTSDRPTTNRVASDGPLSGRQQVPIKEDHRFGVERSGPEGTPQNAAVPQESTMKGAIAC